MVTCRALVACLGDYVSGDFTPDLRTAFGVHLARCPSCRNYVRTYLEASRLARAVLRADAQALPADVPDELILTVLAASARKPVTPGPHRHPRS